MKLCVLAHTLNDTVLIALNAVMKESDMNNTNHPQLHPVFERIVAAFAHPPVQAAQINRRTYESFLKMHHWDYALSNDPDERAAGASVYAMLHALQPQVDPLAEMWNFYAPKRYQFEITKQ